MGVIDFDKTVHIRIRQSDFDKAKTIVKNDPERYNNLNHYFRSAILKLNREVSK